MHSMVRRWRQCTWCKTQLLEDKGSSSILLYFSSHLPLILFQFPHPRSREGLGSSCQCGLSMRLVDHWHVLSHCSHQALYGENIWTGYIQDHHCVYHVIYDRYHVVRTFELGTCKIMTVSITLFVTGITWWELLNWVHASTCWQPSWSFYSELVQQPGVGCLFRWPTLTCWWWIGFFTSLIS